MTGMNSNMSTHTPSPPTLLGGEGWGEGAANEASTANIGEQRAARDALYPTCRDLTRSPLTQPSPLSSRWGRGLGSAVLFCAIALLTLAAPVANAVDPLPFNDRAEEVRFQNLAKQLRCLVCQNQDLADSDADLAKDLRKQVFDMMRSGKTDDEIKQYLVARYNDFVLYDPPLKPGTWLLWFTPFILVLIGACVVVVIVRRRSALLPAESRTSSALAAQTESKQTESAQAQSGDDW
jgi:cytochrome c-type biogenesis protein CcmH